MTMKVKGKWDLTPEEGGRMLLSTVVAHLKQTTAPRVLPDLVGVTVSSAEQSSLTIHNDPVLAKLGQAKLALSQARTMQDAKQIADVAKAAEIYARRQKLGKEAIDYAHAINIEALRRLGEMLKQTDRRGPEHSKGGGSKGSEREPLLDAPPTLEDLGLDKKTSSIAQKLANLPAEQFEQVRDGTASITKALREVEHAKRSRSPVVDDPEPVDDYVEPELTAQEYEGGFLMMANRIVEIAKHGPQSCSNSCQERPAESWYRGPITERVVRAARAAAAAWVNLAEDLESKIK